MTKDNGKYFGSAMMVGFGIVAFYRWQQTQLIFFLLLVLRDFAAGYFFFKRKPAHSKGPRTLTILAYASSAMPLLYFGSTVSSKALFLASDLLAIIGFLIVVLATIELGTSIGISPANRGLVRSGIYRYIKHPMYLGYAISEMGLVILNPLNLSICVVSMILYFIRSKIEIKILNS
ncbi:isoprenylcysteine carboxylmethyltransferase family protein [Bdellovibrio bacteriovorus]|uniref:methyltransferase family protein n=1 Tax=Bdellovibrio bacteriovorus TaxID=959 RepID=UPI0035A5D12F